MSFPEFVSLCLRAGSVVWLRCRLILFHARPRWLVVTAAALMLWGLVGCAAGRAPGGGVVVGVDVASLPESAGDVVSGVSKWLPEPWASLGVGLGSLIGGGALYGVGKRAAHADRDRADAEWSDGHRLGAVQRFPERPPV